MSLTQVEELLRACIGLHTESIGKSAVEAAVRTRIEACRCAGPEAYARLAAEQPAELERLVDLIVVNETWFFREPASFGFLQQHVATRSNRTGIYRVLSLPCSTGEEVYSIAMALTDALGVQAFEVHGVDVSTQALELAERAVYSKNSFRGGTAGHEHHFESAAGGLRVKQSVREHTRFARGNVLDATLHSGVQFDAVFCRNLLIYLDRPARLRSLQNLQRLLRDDGALFVGHSESAEIMAFGFRKLGETRCFAFGKAQTARARKTSDCVPSASRTPLLVAARAVSHPTPTPSSARSSTSTARVVPVREPAADSGKQAIAQLDEARALADRGDLEAARKCCEAHLARSGPSAAAFCLLGIIKKACGDWSGALECLGRALYMDAAHYESLVHAALIHEHGGNQQEASQLRMRAQRSLQKGRS